jgi:hypothetical protein
VGSGMCVAGRGEGIPWVCKFFVFFCPYILECYTHAHTTRTERHKVF